MTKNVSLVLVNHVGMFASKLVIDVILPHAKVIFIKLVVFIKILIILGPFLTIEYFCLITEINTAPARSSLQGYYETGL